MAHDEHYAESAVVLYSTSKSESKPSLSDIQIIDGRTELQKVFDEFKIGNLESCRSLLEDNLQKLLKLRDHGGNNCVIWSAANGHLHILELMHEMGVRIPEYKSYRTQKHRTAFGWAARNGHLEVCKWLVKIYGIDPHYHHKQDEHGYFLAVNWSRKRMVYWFLDELSVDVNMVNKTNCSAILFLARSGDVIFAEELHSKYRLKLNQRNDNGMNAIHKAGQYGHLCFLKWFLGECENVKELLLQRNKNEHTPSECATSNGFADVGKYLEDFEAQLDAI